MLPVYLDENDDWYPETLIKFNVIRIFSVPLVYSLPKYSEHYVVKAFDRI